MPDPLSIAITLILLSTFIGIFVHNRSKDKCLLGFSGFPVIYEDVTEKRIWGVLGVEATGIEFNYKDVYIDTEGHIEKSYILYKREFGNIQILYRFIEELNELEKKKRFKQVKTIYKAGFIFRAKRRFRNFFATIKDSLMEIVNVTVSGLPQTKTIASVLKTQQKYVNQVKDSLSSISSNSYEPFYEKNIGKSVVLECKFMHSGEEKIFELSGILKEYSSSFIEVLDVKLPETFFPKKSKSLVADVILPRSIALIRHRA